MAAKNLKRSGHFADLVAPADIHFGFQVALGHTPHAVGQAPQPARQEAADINPGEHDRAEDTGGADQQQKIAPGQDRLRGGQRRLLDAGAGGRDQTFGLGHEFDGEAAIALEEIPLLAVEIEFPGAQAEYAVAPGAQRDQPAERGREPLAQRCRPELRQAPPDAARGRLEALPQRLQQRGIGNVQRRREKLRAGRGVGPEFGEMAIPVDLHLREMLLLRDRRFAELAISGHRVEQLIVDQWNQVADQPAAQRCQFLEPRLTLAGQVEAFRHRGFDHLDVGHQGLAAPAQGLRARCVALDSCQRLQLSLERFPVFGDPAGDPGPVHRASRRR